MEKFGIFELLDALSAAMEGDAEEKAGPPAPSVSPRTDDAAFAPPAYGEQTPSNPALSLLLEKHEAIKKKASKK